jgi:hypothetical protein
MKYLVLLALIACSSQKTDESKKQTADQKGEPETVVIPYRPGCACTKIYLPVCANGQSFGNECEAKCAGHSRWKQGECK